MPNWVYNTLRVKGKKEQLTQFAESVGSPSAPWDWKKLADVVPMTWDTRDERRAGEREADGQDLVYRFDTAWNPQPQMVEDLAGRYPDLGFELHYREEGPAFAGAAVFAQGRKVGEAYLGDGEEQEFFRPDEVDADDDEWDFDAMTDSLLARARAGEMIDWDARRRRLAQARQEAEEQAADREGYQLRKAVARIQGDPALRQDPQRRNEILIPLASRTGPGLTAIPKAWWNDDLLVAFLLEQSGQAKLIPASLCTETLVDKLMAKEHRNYEGLKVGLRNERQALAYAKLAPGWLGEVPRALRTARVCEEAVRGYGDSLRHVPKALRTAALCEVAVAQDGSALEYVPPALKTAEMCRKAVRPEWPNALKFVPAKFLDDAMMQVALETTDRPRTLELGSVNSTVMRRKYLLQIVANDGWSSIKAMTDREHAQAWGSSEGQALLCKLLEDDTIGLLAKVPLQFHTPEVLATAGQYSALDNFEFIPDRYKTRALCRQAIEDDSWGGKVLKHVPMPLRDRGLCALALDKALEGRANQFRTESFLNELYVGWLAPLFKEGMPDATAAAASARAHMLADCFVETEFPDSVWDAKLAARAMDSSPYAVLFMPRRLVTEEALLDVLREDFGLYLLLDEAVARELAPQAAAMLRDFVGEPVWQQVAKWQSLDSILKQPVSGPLVEALQLHALRWMLQKPAARHMALVIQKFSDSPESTSDPAALVRIVLKSLEADQVFSDWVGRHTLSADELHRVFFAFERPVKPA